VEYKNEMTTRTDTQLLDALESVPWAIEIKYVQGQPKCDSRPSLREQIGRFLDELAQREPPNDKADLPRQPEDSSENAEAQTVRSSD
jgi:hypothetical protein